MANKEQQVEAFPGAAAFYFHAPLYGEYRLPMVQVKDQLGRPIVQVQRAPLKFEGTVDGYCVDCRMETPWRLDAATFGVDSHGTTCARLVCQRKTSHTYTFQMLVLTDGRVFKIGQFPSGATIQFGELGQLRTMLSDDGSKELGTGIGLAAHGVGIGSFVYLRRVIEHLVAGAQQASVMEGRYEAKDFHGKRVSERIGMLDGYLPRFLVENHVVYGVLSKHLHELSEKECLDAFPAIRAAIEMILEERLRTKEQAAKEAAAQQALRQLAQNLTTDGSSAPGNQQQQ